MSQSTNVARICFGFVFLLIVALGIPWGGGAAFLHLNGADPTMAGPFSIFEYWQLYAHSPDRFRRITVQICTVGPWVLLAGLAVWAIVSKNNRPLHGAARFATTAEIQKAGLFNPPGGFEKTILVGKKNGRYLTYGGYQFVILAAPTRSGKGVGIVVPNCLNYSDSLVVLDIKGENFDITSGFRARHGQEVYLFAPFDEHGVTHCYNPLLYISDDPAQRIGDIDAIATALYSGGNQNDKFWSENAKDLFRGICLFVLENPDLPKTLGEILRQASGKGRPLKDHITDELQKRTYSNACVDCLNRILSNSENTLAGIVSTFNTPLLLFQNPRVDMATSKNDFDLRDVRKKRMSIYFKMPPNKLKEGSILVNLFFDQLLNLNTRELPQQNPELKHQCLVLLDEMTSIGKVAMIAQAVSYMAGYNMRLLTIIQNKSQLEDVYGKPGALTLLSNHALMVMYAPSPTVQSDAQEYSEMLGYETVKSKSKSTGSNSTSTSTSDQRRALLLPQEIRELGRTREIVSLENCKPILCDKIRYYEDPDFTCRANLPPPEIPKQDVDRFIAKLEQRIRTAGADELAKNPDLARAAVAIDSLPPVPPDCASWDTERIETFVREDISLIMRGLQQSSSAPASYGLAADSQAATDLQKNFFADLDDLDREGEDEESASAEDKKEEPRKSEESAPTASNDEGEPESEPESPEMPSTTEDLDRLLSSLGVTSSAAAAEKPAASGKPDFTKISHSYTSTQTKTRRIVIRKQSESDDEQES